MLKKFQILVMTVFVIGLLVGGCRKAKKAEQPMPVPEVKEEAAPETGMEREQPPAREEREEAPGKTYPGIEGEFIESSMLKDVHFAFDKSDLSPEARQILSDNAALLKKSPGLDIQVEGHCDERGSTDYNLALGERRAASVKNYLVSLGMQALKISTISYGEEMPVDPGHNEGAWTKNRRAHIIILKK